MSKLTPGEAQSMAALFSKMRGDSEQAQANLEKMLASQSSGTKKLERQFKSLRLSNIKEIRKSEAALKSLTENWDDATDAEKRQIPILKKGITEFKNANQGISKLSSSTHKATTSNNSFTQSLRDGWERLKQYVREVTSLKAMINGVVGLYRNWWRLQSLTTVAMGAATQALGGTRAEMEALSHTAEGMQGMFYNVTGEVDGIAVTIESMTNTATALHRNGLEITGEMARNMEVFSRTLGGSAENSLNIMRVLGGGIDDTGDSLNEFGARMLDFASSIGANAGQLTREFNDARHSIANFGSDGEAVFRDVALLATEFRLETGQLFDMMSGFDTFSGASGHVNQLNAMMGTTLSSYEMMIETDPAQRIEMLRDQLSEAGLSWGNMGYAQQQALEGITGMGGADLATIFGDGRSLEELREQQQTAANIAEERESAQQRMQELFTDTADTVRTWREDLRSAYNWISNRLSPIFEVIHRNTHEIWQSLSNFFEKVSSGDPGTSWIENIAKWVQDMFTQVRSYDWEGLWDRVKKTWAQMLPSIRMVSGKIREMIQAVQEYRFEDLWKRIKLKWDEWYAIGKRVWASIRSGIDYANEAWETLSGWMESTVNFAATLYRTFLRLVPAARIIAGVAGVGLAGDNEGDESPSLLGSSISAARRFLAPSEPTTEAPKHRTPPGSTPLRRIAEGDKNHVQASMHGALSDGRRGATRLLSSAVDSASSAVTTTAETASSGLARAQQVVVQFAQTPIELVMNGRSFATGIMEASHRST